MFVAAHDEFYSDNSDTDGNYAIRVTKLPDADFDNDGVVDMADYGVWRANFGAISGAGLAADGNFDGQVDAADYVLWRSRFTSGMMAARATGSVAPVADVSGSDEPTILAAKSEIQSVESDQGGNRRQVDVRYLAQF